MTTVAFRDGIMAADTQITAGDTKEGFIRKVWRADEYLVGFSGDADVAQKIRWKMDENEIDPLDYRFGLETWPDDEMMFYIFDGSQLWQIYQKGAAFYCDAPFFAMGSGSNYALGAMAMGATARQAVAVAARFDVYTGGRVTWVGNKQ